MLLGFHGLIGTRLATLGAAAALFAMSATAGLATDIRQAGPMVKIAGDGGAVQAGGATVEVGGVASAVRAAGALVTVNATTAAGVTPTYGLGFSGTLDISTKIGADMARSQLLGVLSSLQSTYQTTNNPPSTAPTVGNTSGTATSYQTAQLANYNLALALLG